MMHYELNITPRVIVGADTHTEVGPEAAKLGWSRVLVVSDPFHEKAGRTGEIAQLLDEAGLDASVYTGVTAEPDTEMVERGLQQFKAEKCDGIVALGGGSPIDAAKTAPSTQPRPYRCWPSMMGPSGNSWGPIPCLSRVWE
jgi:alcohol dehydrogenase class IV